MNNKNPFENAPIISAYSRADAIADGVLVDLMQPGTVELIKNAAIKYPVAITAAAFGEVSDPKPHSDLRGRGSTSRVALSPWLVLVSPP